MSQKPLVAILLSTYNGEAYLREQLDSIIMQTYGNIVLYIRDDGSTDHTVSIIKEYVQKYRDKVRIVDEGNQENLGYKGSFWKLLNSVADAEYYAFCDQDDIWLPEKVERGVAALENNKKEIPLLYHSSFVYVNQYSQIIGEAPKIQAQNKLKDLLFYTPAFGFTILINQTLRNMAITVPNPKEIPHDGWCLKIASAFGEIVYDSFVGAKYRRHEKTVTYSSPSKWLQIKKWLANDIFGNALEENHLINDTFLKQYKDVLSSEEKRVLSIFSNCPIFSKQYFKKLTFTQRLRPSWGGELALRLCFLMGK